MKISKHLTPLVWMGAFTAGIACADASPAEPRELRRFSDQAETCMHLSGELTGENTPAQMKLIRQVNQECGKAKRLFKRLDQKYKSDRQAQAALEKYRDALE